MYILTIKGKDVQDDDESHSFWRQGPPARESRHRLGNRQSSYISSAEIASQSRSKGRWLSRTADTYRGRPSLAQKVWDSFHSDV